MAKLIRRSTLVTAVLLVSAIAALACVATDACCGESDLCADPACDCDRCVQEPGAHNAPVQFAATHVMSPCDRPCGVPLPEILHADATFRPPEVPSTPS